MKKKVKEVARDALTLGVAGVGLGVMGGISGTAAPAIGTLGSGLGTIGSLTMMKHGMDIAQEIIPKKKKKGGHY